MSIENDRDLYGMQRVGAVVAEALAAMTEVTRPGVTTAEIDAAGADVLFRHGARSAPAEVYGFPGVNLISVNDEVVHGIPGQRVLAAGDLVKLDCTAQLGGYIADAAVTVPLPGAHPTALALAEAARSAFSAGLAEARAGQPIHTIGRAVEREVARRGFAVIPGLAGHGVGRTIHEEPTVWNEYHPGDRRPLTEGLVITIEPLVTPRRSTPTEDTDGWTIRTGDGGWAAHHEHTIVVRRGAPLILTAA